jgi:G3E family GTPase
VVKTTDLAESAPVALSLYIDDGIRNAFSLQTIVTVADAKHLLSQLCQFPEVTKQIAFAGAILLNKTTPPGLFKIQKIIDEIAFDHA